MGIHQANALYQLRQGFETGEGRLEVLNEWEFIAEHLYEDFPVSLSRLISDIHKDYEGRGHGFETPSVQRILNGLSELQEAGIVIQTD